MKRVATVLALISSVIAILGYRAESLIAAEIVLLICVTWIRGLIGKRAFDNNFWYSFAVLIFLPLIVSRVLSPIAWPLLITIVLISGVLTWLDLRKRWCPQMERKGIERSPLYPLHTYRYERDGEYERIRTPSNGE